MKQLLTLILFFGISAVYGQVKTQTLNKKESKELLKLIDTKTDSDYENYKKIFDKKKKLKTSEKNFGVKYFKGDSLVISFDNYNTKEEQQELAQKIFSSKEFKKFKYIVILFGGTKTEKDDKGQLHLKKFSPKSGIKKV